MTAFYVAWRKPLALAALILLAVAACGRQSGSSRTETATAVGTVGEAPGSTSGTTMIRGSVASMAASELTVRTDSGTVSVRLEPSTQVYDRKPASLARVTPNSFIGVTTVKQPDGSDRATEIHIFPEALRGLGEGSRPMAASQTQTRGKPSTMTNGTIGNATMTNGRASSSTMSNGKVTSATGSTLVVQYTGASRTVTVPANTPVTEIVPASRPLAVGERVVVIATKQPNGSLTSNRVMLAPR